MSLVSVSQKRPGRVYHRQFDHDEARALYADGWSYRELAERFGVSDGAVRRVCDPEFRARQEARNRAFLRRYRELCLGGCGRLVWTTTQGRTGYCLSCLGAQRAAADVRDGELRCTRCREWKPDSEFGPRRNQARRGRDPECRPCANARRREHRRKHPEQAKRESRKRVEKWRKQRMARYIVFQPNGAGFVEVARVDAGSPAHAVEQAATGEGDYIAVSEAKFQVMRVAPVQAFRVVATEPVAEEAGKPLRGAEESESR